MVGGAGPRRPLLFDSRSPMSGRGNRSTSGPPRAVHRACSRLGALEAPQGCWLAGSAVCSGPAFRGAACEPARPRVVVSPLGASTSALGAAGEDQSHLRGLPSAADYGTVLPGRAKVMDHFGRPLAIVYPVPAHRGASPAMFLPLTHNPPGPLAVVAVIMAVGQRHRPRGIQLTIAADPGPRPDEPHPVSLSIWLGRVVGRPARRGRSGPLGPCRPVRGSG